MQFMVFPQDETGLGNTGATNSQSTDLCQLDHQKEQAEKIGNVRVGLRIGTGGGLL
jgi:hypothetical protein